MAEFIGIRSQMERLTANPAGGEGPALASRAPTSVRHRRENPCRTQGCSSHMHRGQNLCAWLWFAELAAMAPVLSDALLCAVGASTDLRRTLMRHGHRVVRARGTPFPLTRAPHSRTCGMLLAQPRCIDIAAQRHVGALAEPPWNTPGRNRTGHGRNAGTATCTRQRANRNMLPMSSVKCRPQRFSSP